jgi:hypothetical protein
MKNKNLKCLLRNDNKDIWKLLSNIKIQLVESKVSSVRTSIHIFSFSIPIYKHKSYVYRYKCKRTHRHRIYVYECKRTLRIYI